MGRVLVNVATPWIRKESKHGVRVRRDQVREAAGHAGGETREAPGLVRGGTDFTQAAHAVGVCPNAPGRSGATAGHVPPAATSGRSRTGAVATWTSASPSPACIAPAAASAPSPGPTAGHPAPTRTPTACRASTPPKGTDPSGYTEECLDAVAMEPNDRPRKTLDYMKPSEKIPEPIDDTATSTPTDTINTNCQQRCCDDH